MAEETIKTNKEAKFSIEQLRMHCQELFGVSHMIFDGAFFDASGEITKKEAKGRIATWLKKEVK